MSSAVDRETRIVLWVGDGAFRTLADGVVVSGDALASLQSPLAWRQDRAGVHAHTAEAEAVLRALSITDTLELGCKETMREGQCHGEEIHC